MEANLLIVKNHDITQLVKTRSYRHPFILLLKRKSCKKESARINDETLILYSYPKISSVNDVHKQIQNLINDTF